MVVLPSGTDFAQGGGGDRSSSPHAKKRYLSPELRRSVAVSAGCARGRLWVDGKADVRGLCLYSLQRGPRPPEGPSLSRSQASRSQGGSVGKAGDGERDQRPEVDLDDIRHHHRAEPDRYQAERRREIGSSKDAPRKGGRHEVVANPPRPRSGRSCRRPHARLTWRHIPGDRAHDPDRSNRKNSAARRNTPARGGMSVFASADRSPPDTSVSSRKPTQPTAPAPPPNSLLTASCASSFVLILALDC